METVNTQKIFTFLEIIWKYEILNYDLKFQYSAVLAGVPLSHPWIIFPMSKADSSTRSKNWNLRAKTLIRPTLKTSHVHQNE